MDMQENNSKSFIEIYHISLLIGLFLKAARLQIHANFDEKFENVFECIIL
jgi:hypothetical protein